MIEDGRRGPLSSLAVSSIIGSVLAWILAILLAVAFTLAGGIKLVSNPGMVQEFAQIGLGQWLRYLTRDRATDPEGPFLGRASDCNRHAGSDFHEHPRTSSAGNGPSDGNSHGAGSCPRVAASAAGCLKAPSGPCVTAVISPSSLCRSESVRAETPSQSRTAQPCGSAPGPPPPSRLEMLAKAVQFFMEVGLMEASEVQLDPNRRMRDTLLAKGYALKYREFNGNHNCINWRGGFGDGIIALLGD